MGAILRRFARLAGLFLISIMAFADYVLLILWRRGSDRDLRQALWLHRYAGIGARVINLEIKIEGIWSQTPLYVFNHLGYLDIITLSAVKPFVFVSKSEVSNWPLFGWHARCAGTLFIDRNRLRDIERVASLMEQKVSRGTNVVLFPEATSTNGKEVLPFRSPLFQPAAARNWSVTPGSIEYFLPGGDASNEICWWGNTAFFPHFWHLFGLREIRAIVRLGQPVQHSDRKELAKSLHAKVVGLVKRQE